MDNIKKLYPMINLSKLLIKKGFYRTIRNDIKNIEYSFCDLLLISYDYVHQIDKKIITVRLCERISNLIEFFDQKTQQIHINYIFSVSELSFIFQKTKMSFIDKYNHSFYQFYRTHNLIKINNNHSEHYFNRTILHNELITIFQLIKNETSSVLFINDSIYRIFTNIFL